MLGLQQILPPGPAGQRGLPEPAERHRHPQVGLPAALLHFISVLELVFKL